MQKLDVKVQDWEKAVKLPDMHNHTYWCKHSDNTFYNLFESQLSHGGFIALNEHAPLPIAMYGDDYKKSTGIDGIVRSKEDKKRLGRQTMSIEDLDGFLKSWKSVAQEYGNNPNVVLGFEVDYIEGMESQTREIINEIQEKSQAIGVDVNHISMSLHYYKGESIFTPTTTKRIMDIEGYDGFVKGYFSSLKKSMQGAIEGFKPDFIGHPGLLHYLVNNANHFCNMSDDYKREVFYEEFESFLDVARDEDIAVEINTSGYDRPFFHGALRPEHYHFWPFDLANPHMPDAILKKAIEKDVKLVVGSDCHYPGDEFKYFDKIYDKLINAGATEVYKIVNREKIEVKLED